MKNDPPALASVWFVVAVELSSVYVENCTRERASTPYDIKQAEAG